MNDLTPQARVQRFRFASFGGKDDEAPASAQTSAAPAPVPPPGPLPLPLDLPAITERDLQAARTESYSQGFREGYGEAQSKISKTTETREESIKTMLEVIANRITLAAESHGDALRKREALMGKLLITAARKIAGDALKRDPFAAVESLLKECLALIAGEEKLTVVVSSTLAAGLRQRIDTLRPMLQGFSGELYVEEDASLLDQDCRVEWGNGYGERNTEELWSEIEAIITKTHINV